MRKTVKKFLVSLAAGAMAFSLLGCATQVGNTNGNDKTNENATPTAEVKEISNEYSQKTEEELLALYQQEEASQKTIHIGYDGGLCQVAIPVAYHFGFFENEGLKTELTASEDSRDALAAGKIDTAAGMIAAWLTSVQNGVNIKFTLGLHTGCAAAYVLPDSQYNGFEKGMKIGFVGAFGGVYHNIANRFVAHDGFTSDDFTWLGFDSSAILLALQNGEVDAIVASEQLGAKWNANGDVKQIRSLTTDDDFKDEACCVLGISGTFLEKNPIASYKITKAVYNASVWLSESEENRKAAAKMLIENGYISGTEEFALSLLNYYKFGLTTKQTEKSLYDSVDEYQQLGILSSDTNADEFKKKIYYAFEFEVEK